ncbi:hypothetical protein JZ751_007559 [Albula glossodonta]|uniref:Uncharacterized protein n=1 Tax=Albula glossodonta TaxID=121402 RepID=A0A8T2N3I6_9TELE|nr:hypothetical protein JZ751_007559 [Albula glossodonta]
MNVTNICRNKLYVTLVKSYLRPPLVSLSMDTEEIQAQEKKETDECPVKPSPPAGPRVGRLSHVKGDLFSCPPEEALAHCISEDCRMGAGIATLFKKKFGGVDELKAQKKMPGECAITKKRASHKPTYDSLRQSLEAMKAHCLEMGDWLWPGSSEVGEGVCDFGGSLPGHQCVYYCVFSVRLAVTTAPFPVLSHAGTFLLSFHFLKHMKYFQLFEGVSSGFL